MMTDLLIMAPAALILCGFLLWRFWRSRLAAARQPETVPANAIVVDGSNVMHWGGEPSVKVLIRVLQELRFKGHSPYVIFDANVGYKLQDRYLDDAPMATLIGVPEEHVLVVAKGVVADEIVLKFATQHNLKVVSNDRFRDWSVQFPLVQTKGMMMRGRYHDGNVVWQR